jgi:AmmeMemoRadiSam system protein B
MNSVAEVREPELPYGWYPSSAAKIREFLDACAKESPYKGEPALAAVSPHAGWYFSGHIAAQSALSLKKAETVVIIGGHLSRSNPILYAPEPAFRAPTGVADADVELLKATFEELRASGVPQPEPDVYSDNSVEVLLPMIVALQPEAQVLWLRSPPSYLAKELGGALGRAASSLDRKVVCIGSSDLTHYGPAYDFVPMGIGPAAVKWVREVNDKAFVDALLAMDGDAALALANKKACACSAGAAVAAMTFALEMGATQAVLNAYDTSFSLKEDESFVGYASVSFY